MCTKGRGTTSVKPPVFNWIFFIREKWFTHDSMSSICPNMIVAVDFIPKLCATSITYAHWDDVILSGHKYFLTLSSNISAAVPGRVFRPASNRSFK